MLRVVNKKSKARHYGEHYSKSSLGKDAYYDDDMVAMKVQPLAAPYQLPREIVDYRAPSSSIVPTEAAPAKVVTAGKDGGRVRLSQAEYMKLLAAVDDVEEFSLPSDFLVSQVIVRGRADAEVVAFTIECSVQVLSVINGWVRVPLCSSSFTLTDARLMRDGQVINHASTLSYNDRDRVTYGDGGVICPSSGSFILLTRSAGLFNISLEVLVPYDSTRQNSVKLTSLPMSPLGTVIFTVPQGGAQISVLPSLGTNETSAGDSTSIEAAFPPTSTLAVQWSDRVIETPSSVLEMPEEPVAVVAVEAKSPVVTVQQLNLFTVGEGVVSVTTVLEYTILHAGVSTFEIEVGSGLRVLGASCSGLRNWEMVEGAADSGQGVAAAKAAEAKGKQPADEVRVLRVTLSYPVESSFSLTIASELEMRGTSGDVILPAFKVLRVARDKGFLAVCASSTVEIDQHSLEGGAVQKIDVKELPWAMNSLGSNPVLLAYKFLAPEHRVALRVRKHDDVAVLVALVDALFAAVIYTPEGKRMFHVKMNLRNNDRQYLRITAPQLKDVWTTCVNDNIVKPARDHDGHLMIPIPKTGNNQIMVEIAYLTEGDPMGEGNGELTCMLPTVDVPVAVYQGSFYVPMGYVYEPPEGELWFEGMSVYTVLSAEDNSAAYGGYGGAPGGGYGGEYNNPVMQQVAYESNISNVVHSNLLLGAVMSDKPSQSGNTAVGVKPVKVVPPRVGQSKPFERLLVSPDEGPFSITIPYGPPRKGCCG